MATKKSTGVRGVSWRDKETLDLLAIWGEEKIQEALGSTHRNLDVFERIAEQMAALGHKRSALECRTKTKAMRHEYKRVCAHNSCSGNAPATCPYFAQLHRILGGDASLRPKRVARSLKLRYIMGEGQSNQQSSQGETNVHQPGDLTTINREDIASTSTFDSDFGSNLLWSAPATELESQIEDSQSVFDSQHEGADMDTSAAGSEVDPGEVPSADVGEIQSGNTGEVDPAEQSAEERIANARQRRKKISVLNDVATQMLQQAERESEAMERRHREVLEKEDRSDEQLRQTFTQVASLDREAFRDAWTAGVAAIESSTNALIKMGEMLFSRRQSSQIRHTPPSPAVELAASTSDAVAGTSASVAGSAAVEAPAKKKRVVKKVKRMDM